MCHFEHFLFSLFLVTSPVIHAGFAFSPEHIVVACLILISEVAAFEVLKKQQPRADSSQSGSSF